ncbi:hypothetical protein Slin14017_G128820 [Septoria linicola]|nr:hypothetical protein Slin14017_G128820 [Septoria linicola]
MATRTTPSRTTSRQLLRQKPESKSSPPAVLGLNNEMYRHEYLVTPIPYERSAHWSQKHHARPTGQRSQRGTSEASVRKSIIAPHAPLPDDSCAGKRVGQEPLTGLQVLQLLSRLSESKEPTDLQVIKRIFGRTVLEQAPARYKIAVSGIPCWLSFLRYVAHVFTSDDVNEMEQSTRDLSCMGNGAVRIVSNPTYAGVVVPFARLEIREPSDDLKVRGGCDVAPTMVWNIDKKKFHLVGEFVLGGTETYIADVQGLGVREDVDLTCACSQPLSMEPRMIRDPSSVGG